MFVFLRFVEQISLSSSIDGLTVWSTSPAKIVGRLGKHGRIFKPFAAFAGRKKGHRPNH